MTETSVRLTHLQQRVQSGELTAEAARQHQHAHLKAHAPTWHCVVQTLNDTPPATGGPLSGVSLAHKDIFDLPGRAPGVGVHVGQADATRHRAAALALLAQAGASQSATLVMAPHACGATAQNPHFPRPINPLHPAMAVGGSSSGSAVAVAAGLTYFSLGTDTAGSVRIPAATCGLVGLKTTHGLIPTEGCAPLAPSLDTIGILARHVDEAQAALHALAPTLAPPDAPPRWRLRAWLPREHLAADIASCLHAWMATQSTQPVDLHAAVDALSVLAQRVLAYEVGQTHRAALLAQQADPSVQALGWLGLAMPPAWYHAALACRGAALERFITECFGEADLVVLPALPHSVPDWDEVQVGEPRFQVTELLALHRFMGFVNYLGLPALNWPIGVDARQRPVCVQVLARPFAERRLLAWAASCAAPSFFTSP